MKRQDLGRQQITILFLLGEESSNKESRKLNKEVKVTPVDSKALITRSKC